LNGFESRDVSFPAREQPVALGITFLPSSRPGSPLLFAMDLYFIDYINIYIYRRIITVDVDHINKSDKNICPPSCHL
jgi:hypothetical protein